jgi:periplasmic divalent cation tolerance protein
MSYVFVYITAPDETEARTIARVLLERRLAAGINIFPHMTAMYWWNGEIRSGPEVVLIAKTREALVEALTETVLDLHSYECPCVVTLPVATGQPAYLQWIADETAGARP